MIIKASTYFIHLASLIFLCGCGKFLVQRPSNSLKLVTHHCLFSMHFSFIYIPISSIDLMNFFRFFFFFFFFVFFLFLSICLYIFTHQFNVLLTCTCVFTFYQFITFIYSLYQFTIFILILDFFSSCFFFFFFFVFFFCFFLIGCVCVYV